MKILVYGGTSYLGNELVGTLLDRGHDIVNISRGKCLQRSVVNYDYEHSYESIIKKENPDRVIYLSACFNNDDIDSIIDVNIKKPLEILSFHKNRHKNVILYFIGTFWQFGDERKPYIPIDEYSCSKKTISSFLDYYYQYQDVKCGEIILHGIYGRNDRRGKVLTYLIDNIRNGREINLSAGEQYLNLSDVKDVSVNIASILEEEKVQPKIEIKSIYSYRLREIAFYLLDKHNADIRLGNTQYRKNEIFNPIETPTGYQKIHLKDYLYKYIDEELNMNKD